jgi:hypothetical protein
MGVIFLVLLVLGAALLYTADPEVLQRLGQEGDAPEIDLIITPFGTPEILNIATPVLLPSPTPLADAVAYRTRVLIRLQQFASALEAFMQANERLQGDPRLIGAPEWRSEIQAALDEMVISAHSLSGFSAVPPEYAAIAAWLDQVGPEAENLRLNYTQGVQSGDQALLAAAGENLNRISELVRGAQVEMAAAGWQP